MDTVLIVEDNDELAFGLRLNLEHEGYRVVTCSTVRDAKVALGTRAISALILDLMLPDGDGLEILHVAVQQRPDLPVIVLSARVHECDRISCLRSGAADFISKPFSLLELLERVRIRICDRRTSSAVVVFGELTLDRLLRRVSVRGERLHLTTKEYLILQRLVEAKGEIVTRNDLLHSIWPHGSATASRAVEFHLGRLRRKIESKSTALRIVNARGIGYACISVTHQVQRGPPQLTGS